MGASFTRRDGFFVGVAIGQASEFTAIAVAERTVPIIEDSEQQSVYEIGHLQRFTAATPYPEQVATIANIINALRARRYAPVLICDATGVGRPVVDLLRKAALRPKAVAITGGVSEGATGDMAYSIPKQNLVSMLDVILQAGRLKIAKELTEAEALLADLVSFKVSTVSDDIYEAAREDLALSASLAIWWAERHGHGPRKAHVDYMGR
jgi:hypothetical protein